MTETDILNLQVLPIGRNGAVQVSVMRDDQPDYTDRIDLARATSRTRLAKAVSRRYPAFTVGKVEAELQRLANELNASGRKPADHAPEVDVSRIVRPELFHTGDVSGVSIPIVTMEGDTPAGKWALFLRWADGRRERRELAPFIDEESGYRLWISPIPGNPSIVQSAGWTSASREAWLDGEPAPRSVDVFRRLCEAFAMFLEFPQEQAAGSVSTLALWSMLSYAFTPWNAVPYLSLGGPAGSGKSRAFEILARVVFRPTASSNMTAPTLFRTMHESGGTLILDEAEKLKDSTPDAGEIRSILLSGYKRGSPARRLEPCGDGKFVTKIFDVFGLKAIAGIAALPPALATRCVRMTMFRAAPGSPKPRLQIDVDPERWSQLRDDLHILSLEHGQETHQGEVLKRLDGYLAVVDKLAGEYGALHVKTQDAWLKVLPHHPQAEWCNEPVHPNVDGHLVIAHAVLSTLGY